MTTGFELRSLVQKVTTLPAAPQSLPKITYFYSSPSYRVFPQSTLVINCLIQAKDIF